MLKYRPLGGPGAYARTFPPKVISKMPTGALYAHVRRRKGRIWRRRGTSSGKALTEVGDYQLGFLGNICEAGVNRNGERAREGVPECEAYPGERLQGTRSYAWQRGGKKENARKITLLGDATVRMVAGGRKSHGHGRAEVKKPSATLEEEGVCGRNPVKDERRLGTALCLREKEKGNEKPGHQKRRSSIWPCATDQIGVPLRLQGRLNAGINPSGNLGILKSSDLGRRSGKVNYMKSKIR